MIFKNICIFPCRLSLSRFRCGLRAVALFLLATASVLSSTERTASYTEISKNMAEVETTDDFLRVVEAGLRERHPLLPGAYSVDVVLDGSVVRNRNQYPPDDGLARIWEFLKYTNREIPVPRTATFLFESGYEYIPNLFRQPWWQIDRFPWCSQLEDSFEIILEEWRTVRRNYGLSLYRADEMADSPGWKSLSLQQLGHWDKKGTALFPRTTQLLIDLKIPITWRGVTFARLDSHSSHIEPPFLSMGIVLTAQLAIQVPSNSNLRYLSVAGQSQELQTGKTLVFEPAFIHESINFSDEDSEVLLVDFYHPGLTPVEVDALNFYYDCLDVFLRIMDA